MANITEISDDEAASIQAQENHKGEAETKPPPSLDHANDEREDVDEQPAARAGASLRRRLLVILFVFISLWLAKRVLSPSHKRQKIIYADRYSDEFKYRPAASPIITETLKDGRIRIRGAEPTGKVSAPTPEPTRKSRRTRRKAKKAKKAGR